MSVSNAALARTTFELHAPGIRCEPCSMKDRYKQSRKLPETNQSQNIVFKRDVFLVLIVRVNPTYSGYVLPELH